MKNNILLYVVVIIAIIILARGFSFGTAFNSFFQ